VVVDEAYREYREETDFSRPPEKNQGGQRYPDCVSWVSRYPNLVVTRTFSKAYGLAGLRIGYAVSHPEVADLMNRIRQPFNANAMALAAATAALGDTDYLRETRRLNDSGREQLTLAFRRMGLDFIPSAGNFIAVDVGRSGEAVYQSLLRKGVIVRPVGNYGLPNHLRVSIGLERENAGFLRALEQVL